MKAGVWLAGLTAIAVPLAQGWGATLGNIRIARHPDHVRIVLDLDAAITFSAVDGTFTLTGLEAESAVMNAAPADAPLKRVILAPVAGGARLSFETASPVTPKAFTLTPDSDGGYRLVVDLFPSVAGGEANGSQRSDDAPHEDTHIAPSADVPAVANSKSTEEVAAPSGTSAALPHLTSANPTDPTSSAAVPGMPIAPALDAPGFPAGSKPTAAIAGPGYSPETLRAERAFDRGDAKEACALANSALQVNAIDLRALVVLGSCRLAEQDGAGAKAAFSSALAQDAAYDRARVGLATALDMMGDQAGARSELSRVLGHEVPPEELTRLVDAFKTLKPKSPAASPSPAPAMPQRIVNNRAPSIVRGPSD